MTGMFLPPPIPTTHKHSRRPRFTQTYAASSKDRYRIDYGAISFAMTESAYTPKQRMLFLLLRLPMRSLRILFSFRNC
jgi:hypothetical protein